METIKPIYLIGYRCTGKSTTGKLLANLMGCPFVDTDRIIEAKFKTTIEEMINQKGWDYFRQKERQALLDTGSGSNLVIATGGGIVLDPANRSFIKAHGICVWLHADSATIVRRLLADVENHKARPKFSDDDLFQETLEMISLRTPLYRKLGQIQINTVRHSPKEAANIIKRRVSHVRQ
ncbi:MAG: shikimate kinase [Desulfobacteraceae bacterium]|nr:shikimate kinase [Desulfobacteraceae bacterium]